MNEYMDTNVQTAASDLHDAHRQLVAANAEIEQQAQRIDSLRSQLSDQIHRAAQFKSDVRAAIVEFQEDLDLDIEKVNDLLDNLGLDPIETEWNIEWTESYTVTITRQGTVSAKDEEAARDLITDDPDSAESSDDIQVLLRDQVGFGNYDVSDTLDIEITNVEEA